MHGLSLSSRCWRTMWLMFLFNTSTSSTCTSASQKQIFFIFFLVVVMIHCKAPLISRVHVYAFMSCFILTIYGLMWVWRRWNIRLNNMCTFPGGLLLIKVILCESNYSLLHAISFRHWRLGPTLLYKWDPWCWNRSEWHTECHKPAEVPHYLTFSCLYMYMVLNCCISFWLGSFFMSWSISSAMCFGRMESSRRSCGGWGQTYRGHHSSRQYTYHSSITNLTCPVSITDIPRFTGLIVNKRGLMFDWFLVIWLQWHCEQWPFPHRVAGWKTYWWKTMLNLLSEVCFFIFWSHFFIRSHTV